jgi:hypothetical protein
MKIIPFLISRGGLLKDSDELKVKITLSVELKLHFGSGSVRLEGSGAA